MATKARPTRPTLTSIMPDDRAAGDQGGKARPSQTVGDFIIAQVEAGVHPITAAGAAGLLPSEYVAWVREGQMVFQRLTAGADWELDFTGDQQDLALFAQRVIRAQSAAVAGLTILSEQVARGGLSKTRTTRKRVGPPGQPGSIVETVTVEEVMLPDPDMLRWRLEHLEPAVYGKKATLAITVQDLADTEVVQDVVEARMRAIIERFAGAIEATATEAEGS